ncbi:PAS domain S-box protein [Hymenobacter gummosus]|uniref:histidine kinase n=1 Tax=Hymenobacter gummosus TaxID=1776032 RepID=A0A3S0H3G2_9BACT|nr:PAS domain-containing protein [Hymenobacter gummosus]RTQ46514.1 PAS domain S-box protein [Hymenobacter gummosus]
MVPPTTSSDYLSLFRYLPGNFLLLAPDAAATIVDHTARHAAVSMKSRAEVVGRPLFEAYPAADQNQADVLRASLEHVRRHLEPHTMPLIRYDLERPAAQGGGLEERYWQATHHPILDEQGRLRFILQETEDVTERHQQMQRELAESANQTRFLLEELPLMMWTTRPDGTADYQNPWWLRFTGRTLAQARDWGWLNDIHPDDQPAVGAAWQQALATGLDYQVEYRLRRHDGQYRWLLVQAVARRDAGGRITAWVGTGTDIHEQKLSQQQLTEKDRLLQQILQLLPAQVATLSGPEHVYTFLNERSTALLGSQARPGVPAASVLPELARNGMAELLDQVYRTGQAVQLNEVPMPQPPAADGSVALRYFDGSFQALTDEQGTPTGILVFGVDVTRRVQAQQRAAELQAEVRQQAEQFRLLVESLPLYVYITDPEGRMLYVNPQRQAYTGQEAAQALAHWEEPVHPEDQPRMRELFDQGRRRRQPWSGEYRLRGRNGEYRWVLTHAVPLLDAAGQVQRWYGSSVDMHDQRQLLQELEQKDEQLQRMLRGLPAIVNTMEGPEHRYTYVSPQMQALGGERVQLGRRVADAQPELAEQGFVQVLDEVYRTGEPYTALEQRVDLLSPATGQLETRYFSFSYQLLPALAHRPETRGILAFAVDMTEQVLARQRAEELQAEVNQRSEQLRRMTEALPAVSFILSPDMRLEYVSPQWHQVTGYPAGTDIDAVWPTLMHPDDQAPTRAVYAQAIARNAPLEFEYRLLHPDGQYRWQVCRAVPELGADGQAVRWYGTLVDNHAQRELQQELLRSEAQFRFMAESIPQVVWTAQPDGRLDYLNQRWTELTGTSVEHALRFGWAELVPAELATTIVGKFMAAMQSGQDYEQESPLRARSGEYRWFLHRATPMRNPEGQVLKWFGTSTDIHDFKQAQQQLQAQNAELRRINQDLDNFVYTASHDLKQPVTNMAGIFQELMRTATFADPAAHTLMGMFEHALHQMHGTIQDLSDVVQVQRQHEQLPAEAIELLPFTREVIRGLQSQAEALGAGFELDFAAVPALQFVRPNLKSILYNLLSNALKYAVPGRPPRVRLSTALAPGGVPVLRVQDNGLGIDLARHHKELFQMFRRFHDHVEGSGMGLYLVNRIVQQLGGYLAVESEVQTGTVFQLYLPGTLPAALAAPPAPAGQPLTAPETRIPG